MARLLRLTVPSAALVSKTGPSSTWLPPDRGVTVATVEDLAMEREIAMVEENAQLHSWAFDRVGPDASGFHSPPKARTAFSWRWSAITSQISLPQFTGAIRAQAYSTNSQTRLIPTTISTSRAGYAPPGTGWRPQKAVRIPKWKWANWRQQPETKGTVSLAAMILRIHHELRSDTYKGRRG